MVIQYILLATTILCRINMGNYRNAHVCYVLCVHTMVARQLDHFCFVYIILLYFLVSFCLVCNLITSHIWINNTNIPKTKCKILKMDERLVLNCDHDSSVNDSYRTLIKSNKNHQFLFNFTGARFG